MINYNCNVIRVRAEISPSPLWRQAFTLFMALFFYFFTTWRKNVLVSTPSVLYSKSARHFVSLQKTLSLKIRAEISQVTQGLVSVVVQGHAGQCSHRRRFARNVLLRSQHGRSPLLAKTSRSFYFFQPIIGLSEIYGYFFTVIVSAKHNGTQLFFFQDTAH
jgi:hypothetical protein